MQTHSAGCELGQRPIWGAILIFSLTTAPTARSISESKRSLTCSILVLYLSLCMDAICMTRLFPGLNSPGLKSQYGQSLLSFSFIEAVISSTNLATASALIVERVVILIFL